MGSRCVILIKVGLKKTITKHKVPLKQLNHTIDRYRDVFSNIGLPFGLSFSSYFDDQSHIADNLNILSFDLSNTNAGFAPFAKYAEKMYSIDKMEDVVKEIAINGNR